MAQILPATPVKDAAKTLEQVVVADLHARVTALEATVKTDASKVATFVKTNWAHFVSWSGIALTAAKVFGKL